MDKQKTSIVRGENEVKQLNITVSPSIYRALKERANHSGIKLYRLVGNILAEHLGLRQTGR